MLASSSITALLVGGGAPAAFAACANNNIGVSVAAVTNSAAINCINIVSSTVTGNVTNTGTGVITANGANPPTHTGITISQGSIGGTVSNAGVIHADATGININFGANISGGITNSGTISHNGLGGGGIRLFRDGTILGGISNGGTISTGVGIAVTEVAQFGSGTSSGGITNSGTITQAVVGIETFVSYFAANISNSGTIAVALSDGIGVNVSAPFGLPSGPLVGATFAGGVANSGKITGGNFGILVGAQFSQTSALLATFAGGISNSGSLSAANGVVVGGVAHSTGIPVSLTVGTFAGGIHNAGTVTATAGVGVQVGGTATSHAILTVSAFSGGISNSGSLTQSGAHIVTAGPGGITIGASILVGGVAKGTAGTAVTAVTVSTFAGGIANTGTITAHNIGIFIGGDTAGTNAHINISSFAGGISNGGTILASDAGILIGGAGTIAISNFAGGITNSGAISATGTRGVAIVVGQLVASAGTVTISTFTGGITNSGTIVAHNSVPIAIRLDHIGSFSGDVVNAAGGSIAGAIVVGSNAGPALGVSLFTGSLTNAGRISITQGSGILVNGVSTFTGNLVNAGTIVGATSSSMRVENVSTFAGAITNSGTITQSGGGMFVTSVGVFGTAAASGGMVNSGSIAATFVGMRAESVSTFLGGIINASGGVITARTGIRLQTIDTFAGGISNAGQIIAASTGIRIQGGVGFAAGSHIVNSGTITGTVAAIDLRQATSAVTIDQAGGTINGAIKLSTNADVLNVNGGTISGNILGQGTTNTINFALGVGTFTYGSAFGFSGIHQTNVSSGTVILDGVNSATSIAVTGGTLQVGDAASPGATLTGAVSVTGAGTLSGHGTVAGGVTVGSGGTLAPGGSLGTLTINGGPLTFNAGSTYAVQIAPGAGNNSSTVVTGASGNVIINGGTVVVTPQPGRYGKTDYVIVATSGGVSGTFAGLTVNGSFTGAMTLDYTTIPGDVLLDVITTIASPLGASFNQQNVVTGINTAILGGASLPPGFQNLGNLSGPALLNALSQLSGESHAGVFQGAFQAGNSFLGLMVNPFVDGRFGGGGFGAAIPFATEERPALPQAAAAFASAFPVKALVADPFERRYGVWGAAYGGAGNVTGDQNVGSHTTTASAAAFAAGIDYRATPDTTVGFALAGGGTSWSLAAGLGGGRSDMFQAGVYGSHRWGPAYVSGALAYNFHDVTTNRTVTIAGTDMLSAHFQANGVGARIEGGYRVATPVVAITPYAAAQVQSIALPRYGESATSGSNQFALDVAAQTATTTRTELGARLDKTIWLDRGALLTFNGRAAWAHDFGGSPSAAAFFQALPGASFIVNGATPARDGALVTGGAQYTLANGWSFLAKLDGEFSDTTAIYSGSGMVRKTW